jgi:putative ABC transport system permease protein
MIKNEIMLRIDKISKTYRTENLVQKALEDVSLTFRANEFIAVLGPSGSGKTTLLNIVGGLDRYDSGDIIINEISTKRYKDRDWDAYRNHTIGFVFQSYNLIPHLTILDNVELALTISGISRQVRRQKAREALIKVGLEDHLSKRPNQLSGGQMQRVAIARALVNDPEILLADEPTGALDSETSVQVLELLREVARDRLVILVTHNKELADQYANRIITLKDGRLTSDSRPVIDTAVDSETLSDHSMGKASMPFSTALSLSFTNLLTKKARTILTSFAGSIGIIGIALILAFSTGVNTYIYDLQRDNMSSYPISIDAETFDIDSILGGPTSGAVQKTEADLGHNLDKIYSDPTSLKIMNQFSITSNNLTEFKKYLDDPNSEIHQYLGENGIIYSYSPQFDSFVLDETGTLVNTDGSTLQDSLNSNSVISTINRNQSNAQSFMPSGISSLSSGSSAMSSFSNTQALTQMIPGNDGDLVSKAVRDSYEIVYGDWPSSYDEVVVVVNRYNEISLTKLFQIGLIPADQYKDLIQEVEEDENYEPKSYQFSYSDIMDQTFSVVPAADYYVKQSNGWFKYIGNDLDEVRKLTEAGIELKVSGIVRAIPDAANTSIRGIVGYTQALTDRIIDYSNESPVVKAQLASPDVNVLNGLQFAPDDDEQKIADAKQFLEQLNVSEKASLAKSLMTQVYGANSAQAQQLAQTNEIQLAALLDQYLAGNPSRDLLLSVYENQVSPGTYDNNLTTFGYVSLDAPSSISIYAEDFQAKDEIALCIEEYNTKVSEGNQIIYTDYVKLLMSSVTQMLDVVTYALIAFVSVSLLVSSIMIGIITYISVLERTKEIGILRAIGASKRNISSVFNAETFIIGLLAGLIGMTLTYLALIPINAVVHNLIGDNISADLPIQYALILVGLSIILTLIGGFIPSKSAARKDPVAALRSE